MAIGFTVVNGMDQEAHSTKHRRLPIHIRWLERQNPERKRKFVVGWGVVFPDIEFDDEDLGWDAAQICDKRNFLIILRAS